MSDIDADRRATVLARRNAARAHRRLIAPVDPAEVEALIEKSSEDRLKQIKGALSASRYSRYCHLSGPIRRALVLAVERRLRASRASQRAANQTEELF